MPLEPGKTTKQFQKQFLSQFGTILCSDQKVVNQVMLDMQEDSTAQVLMLGDFHKKGSVEILVSH